MKSLSVILTAALLGQLAYAPSAARASGVDSGHRAATQFLGGLFLSGVAVAGTVGIAAALPINDSNSQWDSGEIILIFGTPVAFLVANSAAVHHIGKRIEKGAHGRFGPTFLGALCGFLVGGSAAVCIGNTSEGDSKGWVVGLTAAWVSTTLGAVIGYDLSRPDAPAVLNAQAGHVKLGVPVPKLGMSLQPDGQPQARWELPLLSARF
ncbi:MAG: hypothetical protein QGI83_11475 [Candidatus Latescibacteria bacterium]|jgi:hypothetical protein|nr:hypothetical protein [Candidatus Latescibacterota bacterium]